MKFDLQVENGNTQQRDLDKAKKRLTELQKENDELQIK
tara:strand:+ start:1378 stop:1491 length:114 start_codon:yes stop_codon:yes gene_type:complete